MPKRTGGLTVAKRRMAGLFCRQIRAREDRRLARADTGIANRFLNGKRQGPDGRFDGLNYFSAKNRY
jgi:hypothetical protein